MFGEEVERHTIFRWQFPTGLRWRCKRIAPVPAPSPASALASPQTAASGYWVKCAGFCFPRLLEKRYIYVMFGEHMTPRKLLYWLAGMTAAFTRAARFWVRIRRGASVFVSKTALVFVAPKHKISHLLSPDSNRWPPETRAKATITPLNHLALSDLNGP